MNLEVGIYQRPCFAERANGDSIVVEKKEKLTLLAVIDGIGHGPKAEEISNEIANYLSNHWHKDPKRMVDEVHEHMKGSQGAAIGIAVIDRDKMEMNYAGLGNISCKIFGRENVSFVSSNGLLGVRIRSIQSKSIKLEAKNVVMIHSDGVSTNIRIEDFPHFKTMSSFLFAKSVIQNFGNEFDDASCIIVKITNDK